MNNSFDTNGNLHPGIYRLTLEQFDDRFCSKTNDNSSRYNAHLFMEDIIEWATQNDAVKIIIGGSFISSKEKPEDLDLLIIFKTTDQIPKSKSFLDTNDMHVDAQMLSMENEELLNVFVKIFSIDKFGNKKGIVEIEINPTTPLELKSDEYYEENDLNPLYDYLLEQYLSRVIKQKGEDCKGLIIPIHGILTRAQWMPELTALASIEGWAVAPFIYGKRYPNILLIDYQKKAVIESFRSWISKIRAHYKGPISIIAHSFGTYIIAKYLQDGGDIANEINSIILCGSILNENYNWAEHIDNGKIGAIMNIISQDDIFVKNMPRWADSLFGSAGYNGFNCKHDFFTQVQSKILNHNNIIKEDVIINLWLPFLKMNRYSLKHHKLTKKSKQLNPHH